VILCDADKPGKGDHVEQNFQPRGHHRTSFGKNAGYRQFRRPLFVPAWAAGLVRLIARLPRCARNDPSDEKPRRHPEDTDGVIHAFTSGKVAALDLKTCMHRVRSRCAEISFSLLLMTGSPICLAGSAETMAKPRCCLARSIRGGAHEKGAILATAATVAATTISAPAQARGPGPGLAFGLAAAIVAGVAGA